MWALLGLEGPASFGVAQQNDVAYRPQPWTGVMGGNMLQLYRQPMAEREGYLLPYNHQRGAPPGPSPWQRPVRVWPLSGTSLGVTDGGPAAARDERALRQAENDARTFNEWATSIARRYLYLKSIRAPRNSPAVRAYVDGKLALANILVGKCRDVRGFRVRVPREFGLPQGNPCYEQFDLPDVPVSGLGEPFTIGAIIAVSLVIVSSVGIVAWALTPEERAYAKHMKAQSMLAEECLRTCIASGRGGNCAEQCEEIGPREPKDKLGGLITALGVIVALAIVGPPLVQAFSRKS